MASRSRIPTSVPAPTSLPPAASQGTTTIRFAPGIIATARALAARDGMSLGAWIRRLVDQETARRDGTCPTCGSSLAGHEPEPPAASSP